MHALSQTLGQPHGPPPSSKVRSKYSGNKSSGKLCLLTLDLGKGTALHGRERDGHSSLNPPQNEQLQQCAERKEIGVKGMSGEGDLTSSRAILSLLGALREL